MRSLIPLVALFAVGVTAGDFSKSCKDEHVDPTTQILTANCDWSSRGNFGQTCNGCHVYRLPDPVYGPIFGTTRAWLSCTCNGAVSETSIELGPALLTSSSRTRRYHARVEQVWGFELHFLNLEACASPAT
ncbi:CVNH domain-containing protein [Colletotrichum tabaci]|uniref:CVNH domain-containing protein n=1 Tax=Colletotrichum tabaci TaxID=1209068 RepID=A0AAV9T1I2_9PEZI